MDKLEFIFIIIEMVFIIIEVGLEIYSIVDNKKTEKQLNQKLTEIQIENKVLEKLLK